MESRVPHHVPGVSSSLISQPLLDSRVPYGRLQHPLTIYPIDQIKSSHVENDYIDSPTVVSQQPSSQKSVNRRITWLGQNQEAFLVANHNHHHNHQQHQPGRCEPHLQQDSTTHPWISFSGRPSSISSSSSTSSDQKLLDHAAPTPTVDHHPNLHPQQGGVCSTGGQQGLVLIPSSLADKKHLLLCEHCGKCRCTECTLPRTLPSCWVCNQECLCSAQNLVDTATCMCLVKGIFYHCAEDEDDEGSCADKPCSCSQTNCCARWSFMAALSLVLPCLVCYLPAIGLAKLGQKCYDNVSRPGCRCKNLQGGTSIPVCKNGGVEAKVGMLEKQQQGS
uniref:Sprouty homolog 4 (Drosophila) n=1 Tax=Monopterus albus TaxID=43700 RepID=A0A3Q3JYW9_MONAL